jgi:carboxylesterase
MSKDILLPGGEHGVLLLHGLRGSPLEMQHLGKQLHKAGFSVRIPHIRGCGFGSNADASGSSRWEDWVEQARRHYAAMRETCASVAVGGLCIGAVLALALAADRTLRASAVIPLATTLKWDGWGMPWYRIFAPLAYYTPLRFLYSFPERWPFGLKDEKLRDWIARQMRDTGSSIAGASHLPMTSVYESLQMIRHTKRGLRRITAPALLIHAREDDVASPKNAAWVMERIGSRDKRLVILEDCYHIITMDREKERVARECISFLREAVPNAA